MQQSGPYHSAGSRKASAGKSWVKCPHVTSSDRGDGHLPTQRWNEPVRPSQPGAESATGEHVTAQLGNRTEMPLFPVSTAGQWLPSLGDRLQHQ